MKTLQFALALLLSVFATSASATPITSAGCDSNSVLASCPDVDSLFVRREGFGANATGGLHGRIVTVTSNQDSGSGTLRAAVEGATGPVWIRFATDMTIALSTPIQLRSNVTVDGRGSNVQITRNGLMITGGVSNVILTNLTIRDDIDVLNNVPVDDRTHDAVHISNAHSIWLHALSLSNFGDGLVDVTSGARDVTVSWSRFQNHDKTMLINSYYTWDPYLNASRDARNRVTLHHNVFQTCQRLPRLVFGKAHLYNNLMQEWSSYAVSVGLEGQALVENNIFEWTKSYAGPCGDVGKDRPVYLNGDLDSGYTGFLRLSGNLYLADAIENLPSAQPEEVFEPEYCQTLSAATTTLRQQLLTSAGNLLAPPPLGTPVCRWPLSAWTGVRATLTDTGNGIYRLTEDLSNNNHLANVYVDGASARVWSLRVKVKPDGRNFVRLGLMGRENQSNEHVYATFSLSGNGQVTTTGTSTPSFIQYASVRPLSDGYYDCTLRAYVGGTSTGLRVYVSSIESQSWGYQGNGASGLLLREAELQPVETESH
jgi:pectate lyase